MGQIHYHFGIGHQSRYRKRENNMNKIVELLKEVGVFYIATIEGNEPRVRPFSSVTEYEGHAYLCTNNTKDIYKELMVNPHVEISAMDKKGGWIRLRATLVRDDRDEVREAMLNDPTGPSGLYKVGDGLFEVLRMEEVSCYRHSFYGKPEKIEE